MTDEALKIENDNGVLSAAGEQKLSDALRESEAERERLAAIEEGLRDRVERLEAKMADDEKKMAEVGAVLARLVEPQLDIDDDISASVAGHLDDISDYLDYDQIAYQVADRADQYSELSPDPATVDLDYDQIAVEMAERLEVTVTVK